ncbi:head GIN domain-containing protein [Pontibacter sp. CAU 1760]
MRSIQINLAGLVLLVVALLFSMSPQVMAQQLRGNGNIKTETREVAGIEGIDVGGGFTVELTQGNKESLRLEADENLLPNIKTEVRNGVLHIYNDKGITNHKGMKAYITLRELKRVDVGGGVKVIGKSTFKTNTLDLEMGGASKVMLDIAVKELKTEISGASKLELTGRADRVDMELSGASKVEAADLEAKHVKLEASGASKLKVFAKESLDIEASGASAVYYKGTPSITAETSSAARVARF